MIFGINLTLKIFLTNENTVIMAMMTGVPLASTTANERKAKTNRS
jgi:hypothetical protein